MKTLLSFSGGKDSTALLLYAKEQGVLELADVVYCDTGWENPITYEYIQYVGDALGKQIITLQPELGFVEMAKKKKRFPSSQARFCTEELKLKPMKKYIEQFLPDCEIWVGVRAEESQSRAKLPERAFADYYDCDMYRPILKWSWQEVFDIMKRHGIEPNPLYKNGMKRVGCFPCIMAGHDELRNMFERYPESLQRLQDAENEVGRSFFSPGKIPDRYHTGRDPKSGMSFPRVIDVYEYLVDPHAEKLFEEPAEACLSYYRICE